MGAALLPQCKSTVPNAEKQVLSEAVRAATARNRLPERLPRTQGVLTGRMHRLLGTVSGKGAKLHEAPERPITSAIALG